MQAALKVAGYCLMIMFVSCGVGAQSFSASPEEALGIAKRTGVEAPFNRIGTAAPMLNPINSKQ
ncbi:hypothetical protein [Pseudomonas sp.]|uniref:hypothetical protein n=1 Tax=Pseudomonas sp. TaxID=306 RepID=UPI003BB52D43